MAENRISWVDTARGLGMMAILLFHSDKYFAGNEVLPYVFYVENALITFFFVSGYLFQRPGKAFSLPRKLLSILRGIVIPYFIFTAAMALPKAFIHDDRTLDEVFFDILTGHASWFVAALITGECLFSLLLHITKGNSRQLMVASALPYLLVSALYSFVDNDWLVNINFWCWQNAFLMLWVICLGHLYRQREHQLHNIHGKWFFIIGLLCLFVILKWMEYHYEWQLTLEPIHVSSFFLLLVDACIGIWLMVVFCQWFPSVRLIQWTGSHSLVYYFICGGIPLLVCLSLQKMGITYQNNYLQILMVFVLVYLFSTIFTWMIYYFMFFIQKIKKEK